MKICVIGLGYVGLPLALKLSQHYFTTGFDINFQRIEELKTGYDRTMEISSNDLENSSIKFTSKKSDIKNHQVYIVTVPTPVTKKNTPDLRLLKKASQMLGLIIPKNSIVVYESTVYPGVTEDFCGKIIEKTSGLVSGKDFFLGYSPERINPGDKHHTIDRITKVIAGQTRSVEEILKEVYGKITKVFIAKNIKTAEAAKVIENTQRDINIAFMNELMGIFHADQISIYDVLQAAQTKWNFLSFTPGLVGGHCIGVDPYYLASYAKKRGVNPRITLAGRYINDSVPLFLAKLCHSALQNKKSSILMLGLTFKENIPDLRNTKIVPLIQHLKKLGHTIDVVDPLADPSEASHLYEITLRSLKDLPQNHYDCIIGAVPHTQFCSLSPAFLTSLGKSSYYLLDIKNMWAHLSFPPHCHVISL
jgi:UDP-N-acetyl-D-galactosamine dehydrogenase